MQPKKVTGVDGNGKFMMADAKVDSYMVHMLKLQNLMVEEFGVEAKNNDKISGIANLAAVLGSGDSAEND